MLRRIYYCSAVAACFDGNDAFPEEIQRYHPLLLAPLSEVMELRHVLTASPAVVFAHLTEPARFVAAHRVIYRMEALGKDRYRVRVHERMFGIPFTYPATVTSDALTRTVTMRATVSGVVLIEMRFVIEATPTDCTVHEKVGFGGWLPVAPVMDRLFRKLHGQLFANIETAVASTRA